jgi:3-oxoacyl-[acyl-carrier protein] reductase
MPNSVAVVTGASQGIGKATALRLARDFSSLTLVARDEDHLHETAREAKSLGAESLVLPLDLREPAAAEKIVKDTIARFGRIDTVLNIAGAVPQIDLFEMTDAQWDDGMALKFHGARRLTVRAWDALKASKGSVVLLSGLAAYDPKPGFAAVAATNAAIIALAKAFAEQGIKDGVQVNSVSPGAVMTGRRQSFFQKWAPANHMTVEEAIRKYPSNPASLVLANRKRSRSPGLPGVRLGEVDDRSVAANGRRRIQRDLTQRVIITLLPYGTADSTMARMSWFSKTRPPRWPVSLTTTSTMARAKSSARITWFGKTARNAGWIVRNRR